MIVNVYLSKVLKTPHVVESTLLLNGLVTTITFVDLSLKATLVSLDLGKNQLQLGLNSKEDWDVLSNYLLGDIQKWVKDKNPDKLHQDLLQTNVMTSEEVIVKVQSKQGDYHAIATFKDYGCKNSNDTLGQWCIKGHNGNWDGKVLGWFNIPKF